MATILPTDSEAAFTHAVEEAAWLLKAGDVVALPTETVYGLAANAWNAEAVRRIFAVKGRPSNNPLIVHVADEAMITACVKDWPAGATALARAFWPGPLTLVLPAAPNIPAEVRAGGDTVGIRWPAHPLMAAVIRACGFPLAAPSANPSNAISPTTAQHVQAGLGESIPLIVDGGASAVGIESTVVDVTGDRPRVLRPGVISEEEIARVWGGAESVTIAARPNSGPLRSPGQLAKHYSPRAPLAILTWADDAELHEQLRERGWAAATTCVIAYDRLPATDDFQHLILLPADARGYARRLYAALHEADASGAAFIVAEAPPAPMAWAGIRDRLKRASAG